jgi:Tfp pilus assembly protein PilV
MAVKIQRRRRGFSLLEALMASAVLIIGLTGITIMLLHGSSTARNGQQYVVATSQTAQALHEMAALRIESLAPTPGASFDAGTAIDGGYYKDASGRPYQTAYTITDISVPGELVYRVDVQTSYTDGSGRTMVQAASTVISKAPDAG